MLFFVSIFWGHFYFGPYISILPLLVPNLINACYFSHFRHSTNKKTDVANEVQYWYSKYWRGE